MAQDGVEARIGTLTAGREWFKSWRTITGETLADPHLPQLQVMLACMCDRYRFLALVRDFIVFEDDGSGVLTKKMAGYHLCLLFIHPRAPNLISLRSTGTMPT